MIQASHDAHVPTCTSGTRLSNLTLELSPNWICECTNNSCANDTVLAIREEYFSVVQNQLHLKKWNNPIIWVALVRDPESWFYSAVGQWCAGLGQDTEPCNATVSGQVDY